MTSKQQLFEVLNILQNTYPNFEFDQEKLDIWWKYLKSENPANLMKNADRWVMESKFPPTIADLREAYHPAYHSNIIDKVQKWESEASGKK